MSAALVRRIVAVGPSHWNSQYLLTGPCLSLQRRHGEDLDDQARRRTSRRLGSDGDSRHPSQRTSTERRCAALTASVATPALSAIFEVHIADWGPHLDRMVGSRLSAR